MRQRLDRINELILQELGQFINKDIELPANSLVTITKVHASPDLKSARVFVTILPDNLRGTILELLNKNKRTLHELLKAELKTKFVPNLQFVIDEQEIFAQGIDKLLDEIHNQ
ncbi:MAG: ribosome-binding factor A [Candidatus Buchananbacteria bacterium RBG_13_39_9]|uniref:Ribosome-binding factor A n=1 Tax=Candidatus Buchananbacteria bacterium RBG_13_39_9 TaxID=1797531 RepID=A0A1G1XSQ0_9BACT|nr:MAG: ribosome-binding factor A [Candidatus Buchananbacteria bacterium RBG_13_39_9]